MNKTTPEIIIITGKINSGKTTMLEKLVDEEKSMEYSPSGIIARGVFEGDTKIGFDVTDLSSGITTPLARIDKVFDDGFSVGKYFFSNVAFKFAQNALLKYQPNGVVFLDEAGPLELDGRGYAECLTTLINSDISRLYIAVRDECLNEFILKFVKSKSMKIIKI